MTRSETIYISDLDGTLLQPDGRLSAFSRKAIETLLENNVQFTVATARSVTSTRQILGNLPFRLPVICSNGGSIYRYGSAEPLNIEFLPPHVAREVVNDIKEKRDTAFVSSIIDGKEKVFYDGLPNEGMEWYFRDREEAGDNRLTLLEDIRDCTQFPMTTITFMNRNFHIEKTKKFFLKNYKSNLRLNYFENKYSPGWHWLSMHSPKSNKATALERLLEISGKQMKNVTVFGDELNDIPMFERAAKAVAVGNAQPAVKAIAHEIIGDHGQNSVVNYILKEQGMEGLLMQSST